jgi:hypothetical protein
MKMKLYFVCAGLALAAAPCLAAGTSWSGTWKLNPAKSRMTGETYTIEAKGDMLHFQMGPIGFDYRCDGKTYPTYLNNATECTGSPAAGYDVVESTAGKVAQKWRDTFSADGKTWTRHGTNFHPDGTTSEFSDVFKRLSGSTGLVGKWENVKVQEGPSSFVLERNGDSVKYSFPAYKETVEGKADGSNLTVTGPTVPAGVTVSYKPEGANKLHWATTYNGKVVRQGTDSLSADGNTLIVEEWRPGNTNEKQTYVYDRQ